MIEPEVIHVTKFSSVHKAILYRIGPVFAFLDWWPEGASWMFFSRDEWPQLIEYYKSFVEDEYESLRYNAAVDRHFDKTRQILSYSDWLQKEGR